MDRVFLDANVLVSAAKNGRRARQLLAYAKRGGCELLYCEYVVSESLRHLTDAEIQGLSELLPTMTLVPDATSKKPPVPIKPKDAPVLMAAIEAKATHLLTRDNAHFRSYFNQTVEGVMVRWADHYIRENCVER